MAEPVDQHQAFYGVISARICMSIMSAASVLNEDRWDDRVLQAILANFRTTGRNGLRAAALTPSRSKRRAGNTISMKFQI